MIVCTTWRAPTAPGLGWCFGSRAKHACRTDARSSRTPPASSSGGVVKTEDIFFTREIPSASSDD
jgi:hypothetical protein